MSIQHKIKKYTSKLQNCQNVQKKAIYRQKLEWYTRMTGGFGETNALIVFDSSKIVGSPLEQALTQNSDKALTGETLMSRSDLEKLLKNNAYVVEEKKNDATLFGTGVMSGLLDSAKKSLSSIDVTQLVGTDIKKVQSELKNMESSLNTVKKASEEMKKSFAKRTEETKKIKENYNTELNTLQTKGLSSDLITCTDTIMKTTNDILDQLNNRDAKMIELESLVNDSTAAIADKLSTLRNAIKEVESLNTSIATQEKKYNDGVKEYNKCVAPEGKIKLSAPYSIANYKEMATEIKQGANNKMVLDGYILCTFKTVGKNALTQIGKI
jgi:hypothetical protein